MRLVNKTDNLALAESAQVLLGLLPQLRQTLKSILEIDANDAIARGYSPVSLDIGPLTQWLYVIDTHLAARPVMPNAYASDDEIVRYARYLTYLIDHLLSDDRFVSEMQLSWSRTWLTQGQSLWHEILERARIITINAPRPDREQALVRGFNVYYGTRSPRD